VVCLGDFNAVSGITHTSPCVVGPFGSRVSKTTRIGLPVSVKGLI